eukprot:TRINITY_DN4251_c0_g1_i5.p1 TRINITY_DN4251_c0_g1~~TRINITY_DN4251_c0_g1_i5.p1  ORF type:complete len:396 (+),score=101.49 TRINITY_DN4251_c0_g1_i5:2049-3236(+)
MAKLSARQQDIEQATRELTRQETLLSESQSEYDTLLEAAHAAISLCGHRKKLTETRQHVAQRLRQSELSSQSAASVSPAASQLALLQRTHDEAEAELAGLTARQTNLRLSISKIENELPSLIEKKQLAVSGKNFKEAGRLNAEIKVQEADKAARETELQQCSTRLLEKASQVEQLKERVEEQRAVLLVEMKARQLQRLAVLVDAILTLSPLVALVSKDTEAASDLRLVSAELTGLQDEASAIERTYDVSPSWTQLLKQQQAQVPAKLVTPEKEKVAEVQETGTEIRPAAEPEAQPVLAEAVGETSAADAPAAEPEAAPSAFSFVAEAAGETGAADAPAAEPEAPSAAGALDSQALLIDLSQQLEKATAAEDFERAEEIQTQITKLEEALRAPRAV